MKLFRHGAPGREKPGVIAPDGTGRDLSGMVEDLAGGALDPDRLRTLRPEVAEALPPVPASERIGPCVGRVGNFLAVGLNYVDHALESGFQPPSEPVLFNKAPSCLAGPNDDLRIPPGAERLDWEVELAIVIGRPAYRVTAGEAPSVIAGYALCNDVSERTLQLERQGQWTKGKSAPGFGPLGPWLVTPDEVQDVQALDIWLEVNGERRQSANTRDMIFGVHDIVAYVSEFMALQPGDVIATGTPPGVGLGMRPPSYLRAGDVVELGISGLGTQRQRVVA